MLHNLTSNMLRYGFGNAQITLEGNDTQAVITYVNQVSGLTQEDVSHLFDPFYTADQARTSRRSGLGMTVARLLTQQMGGSMEAELTSGADSSRDNDFLKITCRFPLDAAS